MRDKKKIKPDQLKNRMQDLKHLEIIDLEDKVLATISDEKQLKECTDYFRKFRKKNKIVKVLYNYKIQLTFPEKAIRESPEVPIIYRVTKSGMVLLDIAASSVQTGYIPKKKGFMEFLESLIS